MISLPNWSLTARISCFTFSSWGDKVHLWVAPRAWLSEGAGEPLPCGLGSPQVSALLLRNSGSGSSAERPCIIVQHQAGFTEGIISRLSTLCEPFNFQGEQEVLIHLQGLLSSSCHLGLLECESFLFFWPNFSQWRLCFSLSPSLASGSV